MKRVIIEIRPCMMANRNSLIRLSNKVDDTGSELKYIYVMAGYTVLLYNYITLKYGFPSSGLCQFLKGMCVEGPHFGENQKPCDGF